MSRYTGPKNRICRRFGANLFGRARNPLLHKPNAPGVHGLRRRKKSDYGLQLDEQQKLKAVYGMIRQKKLVDYFRRAGKQPGVTSDNFVCQLECRLDNMVYKMKFAPTIFAAQQLVSHGHVLVDGKRVDRRSFQVKPGMKISVSQKAQNMAIVKDASANSSREAPEYINLHGPFEAELAHLPKGEEIEFPLPISVTHVCEFLSHTT